MKIRSEDGFTLLEVMMGLVIFTVGLLLLSSMMVVAIKGNVWSDKTTAVVQATREKVEEFRRLDPDVMSGGADVRSGLNRSWTIADISANLKQLSVVVSYANEKSVVRACTTITYIEVGE